MRTRPLGRTGLAVSSLTFGCGNVGGLLIRGDEGEQREAIARALDAGVSYFDTAPLYGDGASEETLGRLLPQSEHRAVVGTKVRLTPEALAGGTAAAVREALDASLRRLRRDSVELYQLHNTIDDAGDRLDRGHALSVDRILNDVLPALEGARRAGKVRHIGFTALGEAGAIERLAAAGGFETAQVPYSLLNPSAGREAGAGESARLLRGDGLGTIGIRLLAGGALGSPTRHAIASPTVAVVGQGRGTARDYAGDVTAAAGFHRLVEAGAAASLPALAIRYGLSAEGLDTAAVGFSSLAQVREALDAIAAGPLEAAVLDEIHRIQAAFADA